MRLYQSMNTPKYRKRNETYIHHNARYLTEHEFHKGLTIISTLSGSITELEIKIIQTNTVFNMFFATAISTQIETKTESICWSKTRKGSFQSVTVVASSLFVIGGRSVTVKEDVRVGGGGRILLPAVF